MLSIFWSFLLAATPAVPAGFDAAAHTQILAAHAEGAQIY